MSIVINIYYTGTNDNAKKFMKEMIETETVDSIRKEDGNEKYEYFLPVNDCQTVLLIDKWKDQKSLDAHHSSPMMKKIIQLRKKYDLSMKVERLITDDNNIPSSDLKFIKK